MNIVSQSTPAVSLEFVNNVADAPYRATVNQILDANLQPATIIFALRLLRLTPDTGSLCLDWEEALNLASGITNRGSLRRHLVALKQADILHYATNGHVLVAFVGYDARAETRGDARLQEQMDTGEAVDRAPAREDARSAREDARPSARDRADSPPTSPNVCLSVDPLLNIDPFVNEKTNKQVEIDTSTRSSDRPSDKPTDKPTASESEKANCFALLIDPEIGISPEVAETWLDEHQPSWLERQAFAYLEDKNKGKVNGPGALVNRVVKKWNAPRLIDKDLNSELYLRTHPEYAAERAQEAADLAEQAESWLAHAEQLQQDREEEQQQQEESQQAHELIWEQTLAELALMVPAATFDAWLCGTQAVAYEDGNFIVGLPNVRTQEWLEAQMRKSIERVLSSLVGQAVMVGFEVLKQQVPAVQTSVGAHSL